MGTRRPVNFRARSGNGREEVGKFLQPGGTSMFPRSGLWRNKCPGIQHVVYFFSRSLRLPDLAELHPCTNPTSHAPVFRNISGLLKEEKSDFPSISQLSGTTVHLNFSQRYVITIPAKISGNLVGIAFSDSYDFRSCLTLLSAIGWYQSATSKTCGINRNMIFTTECNIFDIHRTYTDLLFYIYI